MEDKFCLSPWRDQYGDDHFQSKTRRIFDKRTNIVQFLSARQPKQLNRFRARTKQSQCKLERQGDSKQNNNKLQAIKTTHRSAEITPNKKQPLKLSTITNNTSLVFGPKTNSSGQKIVKDSHQILIDRLMRLKKEGKLHLKQSVGHRILRF